MVPQTLLSVVSPVYPITLPLLSQSPATHSQIPFTPQLCQSNYLWSHNGESATGADPAKNKTTLQKRRRKERKKKPHLIRRGLNKNCRNPWGKLYFLKGNSVLQLLPSHLFTVIPAQVRFRIPALQGLRHNNAWHLAFLLLLELITTV